MRLLMDPVLGMAIDRLDELVWRTVTLVSDVPYRVVRVAVRENLTTPGRPVSETVLIASTAFTYRAMLDDAEHPLSKQDMERYARMLTVTPPSAVSFDSALGTLASLWPTDRRLSAICCNHMLIQRSEGLFAPAPEELPFLEHVIATRNAIGFEDGFIKRLPGMMTRKEEHDALGQSRQPA